MCLVSPSSALAELGLKLSVSGIYDSESCTSDCALSSREDVFGALSALVSDRFGPAGIFFEFGGNNQGVFVSTGGAFYWGPMTVRLGPLALEDRADRDFPGSDTVQVPGQTRPARFDNQSSTEFALGGQIEVEYRSFFIRFARYPVDHEFSSTARDPATGASIVDPRTGATITRSAEPDYDVNMVWFGYRFDFF